LRADTPAQLENRAINAPLLRYVDSMRTHGHRAASIDPLDLIHREEVAALDPARYGLTDENKRYNVDGIVWTRPVEESRERTGEGEWWTLKEITRHLREVYVGRIAYEVSTGSGYAWMLLTWIAQYMHSPSKTERLWFSHLLESHSLPSSEDKSVLAPIDQDTKKRMQGLLARSEVFDNFLQAKFPNLKRVRSSFPK